MANQEHVDRLKQGIEGWNQWRKVNRKIKPDLSIADLRFAKLSGANLSRADLRFAKLNGADLSHANLSRADLTYAALGRATLINTDLTRANLTRANLAHANLSRADLSESSLGGANLNYANLRGADLSYADLVYAAIVHADLRYADLSATQSIGTSFRQAILTGACISDWNINADTDLGRVICKYIFKGYDFEKQQFTDRRPHSLKQSFAPGEFTKRYQVVLETVELFFDDGIDWKALLGSLQNLQAQYETELNIQGLERKASGSFVVRLEVPPDADKGTVEHQVKEQYEANLKIIEAQYRAELQELKIQHSEEIIALYRQHNAEMSEITKSLASRSITVEAKAEAVADNQSKNTNYYMQGSKFGGGMATEGGMQLGGQLIDTSGRQNLAEAAAEIQQLLDQLSATYPTETSAERMVVAAKAVEEIENNPALKQRVISALKAGGTEALKELVDHPAVNILLATIDGWQNPT